MFCTPNAIIQEQSLNIHYNVGADLLDYLENPALFEYENGYIKLLKGPGLGVSINEEVVRQKTDENMNWKNPVWRLEDGTIAEW